MRRLRRRLYLAPGELTRFLGAMERGEAWRQVGERFLMETPHAQAIVKFAVRLSEQHLPWSWGVRLLKDDRLFGGRCATEHEAMRAAERVIEEHRP